MWCGDRFIGTVGQIHPLVAENYGVDEAIYCAELSFDGIFESRGAEPVYTPLPRFPATTRDLSVVCAKDVTVAELKAAIESAGGLYLKGCDFVDVYTGAPILSGYKSVTFALTLRADDQTLTVKHADDTVNDILASLEKTCGAVIR